MIYTSQGKNSEVRWKMISDEIKNFNGKTLVDIGCEYGWFSEKFLMSGGKSAHGIEINDEFRSSCDNLNLKNLITSKELPSKQFDICFYLSLHFHNGIDYLQWCKDHSKMLFIETSGNPSTTGSYNNKLKDQLVKLYKNVKELGITDYAGRILFLCY